MIGPRHAAIAACWLLLVGGCATAPNPELERARAVVQELSKPGAPLPSLAPAALAKARQALIRAEAAQAAEQVAEASHRARLALIEVEIARAKARQRAAQQELDKIAETATELRLRLREAKVERALAQARAAERRAADLRAAAIAERAQTRSASSQLDVLQNQLAELKPRLTGRGLVLTLGEVLFAFESARLKAYTKRIMDRLAAFLFEYQDYAVAIEGHTDSTGEAQYNQELSSARAQSVATALIARGVEAARIQARGFGETRPTASNETAAGRRQNRRVEVVLH